MAVSKDYLQYVLDQLSRLRTVTSRRMFGGIGLYCDDVFFGLLADDTLYFKVDDSNRADYEAEGMGRFRPFRDKPHLSLTYYEVPAHVLEDGEALASWARKSLAAATATVKSRPRKSRETKNRGK
ncbi:MAG: regulator of competence-specific s [Gammaproteobacteria bacterium]|jgi:DNA transformation protein|nr:regulator of competence-specific s [Gammaproteobacteria bacterium]